MNISKKLFAYGLALSVAFAFGLPGFVSTVHADDGDYSDWGGYSDYSDWGGYSGSSD